MKCVSSGPAERAAEVPDLFWSTATKYAGGAAEKKFEFKVLWENLVGGKQIRSSYEPKAVINKSKRERQTGRRQLVLNKEDERLSSAVSWSSLSVLTLSSI